MDEVRPQPMNILDGISNRMRKVMSIDNGSINNGIFLLVAEFGWFYDRAVGVARHPGAASCFVLYFYFNMFIRTVSGMFNLLQRLLSAIDMLADNKPKCENGENVSERKREECKI